MKTSILVGVFVVLMGAGSRVFAVWPPATSLQEDETVPVSNASAEIVNTLPRPRGIADRLDQDTQRMENALNDLKKDQQELKKETQEKQPVVGESK